MQKTTIFLKKHSSIEIHSSNKARRITIEDINNLDIIKHNGEIKDSNNINTSHIIKKYLELNYKLNNDANNFSTLNELIKDIFKNLNINESMSNISVNAIGKYIMSVFPYCDKFRKRIYINDKLKRVTVYNIMKIQN